MRGRTTDDLLTSQQELQESLQVRHEANQNLGADAGHLERRNRESRALRVIEQELRQRGIAF